LILELLEEGAVSLTTVGLLAPHLDEDNHERILGAARNLSKREVEKLVAALQSVPPRHPIRCRRTQHGRESAAPMPLAQCVRSIA
jgi:hypothetical protein